VLSRPQASTRGPTPSDLQVKTCCYRRGYFYGELQRGHDWLLRLRCESLRPSGDAQSKHRPCIDGQPGGVGRLTLPITFIPRLAQTLPLTAPIELPSCAGSAQRLAMIWASFTTGNESGAVSALAATSILRRALLSGGDLPTAHSAIDLLRREVAPSAEGTGLRLTRHLARAFTLLADQRAATSLLGNETSVLANAVEDLLWQAECALLQPNATTSIEAWEERWLQGLPAPLAACLEADEASFTASLDRAREPASSRSSVEEPSEAENELLQAFLEEMNEGLDKAEQLLLELERTAEQTSLLHGLFRQYHTLKGAAAAVDLHDAASQLHEGESLLQALRDGELELPTANVVDFFLRLGDSVRAIVDEACGRPVTTSKITDLDSAIAALLRGEPGSPDPSAVPALPDRRLSITAPPLATPAAATAPEGKGEFPQLETLRAKAARGELDPELLAVIEALERRAEFFSTMAASLQAEVQQLRTVAIEEVFRRLGRAVRDAAKLEGKQVRLEVAGEDLRIAKDWAEPLSAALLHLVRNAVAHGIEPPTERIRRGKPGEGRVRVEACRDETGLCIRVADDGRGIDYEAIRNKAVALGWLDAGAPWSEELLLSFLFRPGFSTRSQATELAGRGVGMDVVATEIRQLGGDVHIRSTPGAGTVVTLVLPESIRRNSG
jgi:two-component system chemotaxis sensor kinase CheA